MNNSEHIRIRILGKTNKTGTCLERCLYSLEQRSKVSPDRVENFMSGDRFDIYFLKPGRYLIETFKSTISGKRSCNYDCLVITEKGYCRFSCWDDMIPEFVRND